MEDYRITNIGTLLQLFCNHVLSLIKIGDSFTNMLLRAII